MTRRWWIGGVIAVVACGRPPSPAPSPSIANRAARVDPEPSPEAAHEAFAIGLPMPTMPPARCEDRSLRSEDVDLDGNGKVDVRKRWTSDPTGPDKLVCKLNDFNQDGRFDEAVVHDRSGTRIGEYADFDFDGRVDSATLTDPATGTTRIIDTDADGRIDAVDGTSGPP